MSHYQSSLYNRCIVLETEQTFSAQPQSVVLTTYKRPPDIIPMQQARKLYN